MTTEFSDLMLILVKGRRRVQVRLIEPVASSINSGDNYILVTPTEIYNFVGKYSRNVVERIRSSDIANTIIQNQELGCTAENIITISEEEEPTCSPDDIFNFWKLLGTEDQENAVTKEAGDPDEDKLYETSVLESNMVYELIGEKLIPFTEYCGVIPKIEMLDPTKVMVFDFGTEMYVWNGKETPLNDRELAFTLASELWEQGYDYADSVICPFTPVFEIGQDLTGADNKASSRPDWCLLTKVSQELEPILFREKFLDWPNRKQIIRMKGHVDTELGDGSVIVNPIDINLILEPKTEPVDLVLEGIHLGRGTEWFDDETQKMSYVETLGMAVWHVDEDGHTELEPPSFGQFYGGDSYVIRWMYRINTTGRETSGQLSKYPSYGRTRFAYFMWQGEKSSTYEKGNAAVFLVMMDDERGPQVRVVQGFEPPAFLNLFSGGMVVHMGDMNAGESDSQFRLYICRSTIESEALLVEVPCVKESLRSRCSFVLLDTEAGRLYIWHGSASLPHVKACTLHAANKFRENKPAEVGLATDIDDEIIEMDETEELQEFLDALGDSSNSYLPLSTVAQYTPRLFHLSSATGEFAATELLCPQQSHEVTPYPFIQKVLYRVSQPALFVFDDEDKLWIWQGWWPESEAEDQVGSGALRWQLERRTAMTTAIEYWRAKHPDTSRPSISLVWAGLEPIEFTNLFPMWEMREDIAELNLKDGHEPGAILSVKKELKLLSQDTFSLAELLERPLPVGVDPTNLEEYLSPEDFQEVFGMTIEEFQEIPAWRQDNMKKEVGLF